MDRLISRCIVSLFANDFHRMSVQAPNFVDALESYKHPTYLYFINQGESLHACMGIPKNRNESPK